MAYLSCKTELKLERSWIFMLCNKVIYIFFTNKRIIDRTGTLGKLWNGPRDIPKSKNLCKCPPNLFCLGVAQVSSVQANLRVQEMARPQAALPRAELCVEWSVDPLFLRRCRLVRGGDGGSGSGGLLGQGLPLATGALRRAGAVPRDAALGPGLAGTGRRGLGRSNRCGEARG